MANIIYTMMMMMHIAFKGILVSIVLFAPQVKPLELLEAELYEPGKQTNITLCMALQRSDITNRGNIQGKLVAECDESREMAWFLRHGYCRSLENPVGVFIRATQNITNWDAQNLLVNVSSPTKGLWLSTDESEKVFAENKIGNIYYLQLKNIKVTKKFVQIGTIVMFVIAVLAEALAVFLSNRTGPTNYTKVSRQETTFGKQLGAVFLILAISTCTLLLVYYWTGPMVYFVRVWAGLLAMSSQYGLLNELVLRKLPEHTTSKLDRILLFEGRRYAVKMKHVVFVPICSILPLIWIIGTSVCDESTAFNVISQNLCLFMLCAYFGSMLSFSKFWIVILIQAVFVIYDVFFVFLTPLLSSAENKLTTKGSLVETFYVFPHAATVKNDSVMEYVAFHLRTLIAFRIPTARRLAHVCDPPGSERSYTLLGLGDILIPAFLGNYCRLFDSIFHKVPAVTIIFLIAYAIGLCLAFGVSMWSMRGQPALLYINPATCAAVLIFVAIRRELVKFVGGIIQ